MASLLNCFLPLDCLTQITQSASSLNSLIVTSKNILISIFLCVCVNAVKIFKLKIRFQLQSNNRVPATLIHNGLYSFSEDSWCHRRDFTHSVVRLQTVKLEKVQLPICFSPRGIASSWHELEICSMNTARSLTLCRLRASSSDLQPKKRSKETQHTDVLTETKSGFLRFLFSSCLTSLEKFKHFVHK